MDTYVARRSGTVGHEILADGEVVAWTVDGGWAAAIVALLNGAEGHDPTLPHVAPKSLEWRRLDQRDSPAAVAETKKYRPDWSWNTARPASMPTGRTPPAVAAGLSPSVTLSRFGAGT